MLGFLLELAPDAVGQGLTEQAARLIGGAFFDVTRSVASPSPGGGIVIQGNGIGAMPEMTEPAFARFFRAASASLFPLFDSFATMQGANR